MSDKHDRDVRLGELLVARGLLKPEKLEEALRVQARPNEKRLLGQILIGRGYIKRHQVKVALAKQKRPLA